MNCQKKMPLQGEWQIIFISLLKILWLLFTFALTLKKGVDINVEWQTRLEQLLWNTWISNHVQRQKKKKKLFAKFHWHIIFVFSFKFHIQINKLILYFQKMFNILFSFCFFCYFTTAENCQLVTIKNAIFNVSQMRSLFWKIKNIITLTAKKDNFFHNSYCVKHKVCNYLF